MITHINRDLFFPHNKNSVSHSRVCPLSQWSHQKYKNIFLYFCSLILHCWLYVYIFFVIRMLNGYCGNHDKGRSGGASWVSSCVCLFYQKQKHLPQIWVFRLPLNTKEAKKTNMWLPYLHSERSKEQRGWEWL